MPGTISKYDKIAVYYKGLSFNSENVIIQVSKNIKTKVW